MRHFETTKQILVGFYLGENPSGLKPGEETVGILPDGAECFFQSCHLPDQLIRCDHGIPVQMPVLFFSGKRLLGMPAISIKVGKMGQRLFF